MGEVKDTNISFTYIETCIKNAIIFSEASFLRLRQSPFVLKVKGFAEALICLLFFIKIQHIQHVAGKRKQHAPTYCQTIISV